jgi:glyoxylase-like metal-dependent hydrolase (beta-lactamase superfamily II)
MSFISKIPRSGERSPDIYQITVRGANVLLVADKELTLIDTGHRGSTVEIVDCIQQLGRKSAEISLIILTHNHIDHVGGLSEIRQQTNARVAIHKNDIGERKNLPSARAEDIDIWLEGGELLDLLGGLQVIHTPGHTPGSICLYSPENRLLIVGDAIRKRRDTLDLPFRTSIFDLAQAKDSIRKMAGLESDIVCFGHGLPIVENSQAKIQELAARNRD